MPLCVCLFLCLGACVLPNVPYDILGLLVDPVKACVFVYIDQKRMSTAMPLSKAAKTALSDSISRVIFCVDLGKQEQAVCITNRQPPA